MRAASRPTAAPPPQTATTIESMHFEVSPPIRRGLALSWRAVALLVVLTLLAISYGSSVPVYLRQQREIAAYRAEVAARDANIHSLEDQIRRWQDPDYVRAQARDRLGWAVPGERGYVVVGPDGKPVQGSSAVSRQENPDKELPRAWWQKGWESVRTADSPGKK